MYGETYKEVLKNMAHSRKQKMEYWRTSWIGDDELDLYKQGEKIIAYKNGVKFREWKDFDRFRITELKHIDDIS